MEDDKISLFQIVRPQDHNVLSAVSDKRETVTIYRYSQFGVGSTIDATYASSVNDEIYDQHLIETKTLNEIIEESPYKGKQIDVLSIDVEGMDFRVISSLDFDTYRPKIIIVEDHHNAIEEIMRTDTYVFLKNKGYVLRSWTFYSLIFMLPNSNILKDRENVKKAKISYTLKKFGCSCVDMRLVA